MNVSGGVAGKEQTKRRHYSQARMTNICLRGLAALASTKMKSQTGDSIAIERHQLACTIVDGDVDLIDHLQFHGNIRVKRSFEDDLAQCMARLRVESGDC